MNEQDYKTRELEALESIAESLKEINDKGIDIHLPSGVEIDGPVYITGEGNNGKPIRITEE